MKLKTLIDSIEYLEIKNGDEKTLESVEISSVEFHSKKVKKGTLFVAIKGYRVDGHDFIKDAVTSGSVAAIVEDFVEEDILQIKVKNSRIALAKVASIFFGEPSKKLKVTGITASNGKTSTAFMTKCIYDKAGYNTGISGTVYTKYADVEIPSILTTPESKDLQYYFYDMVNKGIDHVIMEVSSSAGELARAYATDFDIVTFNNITPEHIVNHGSFERYYHVKSRLIRHAKEECVAILNSDFELINDLRNNTKAQVVTYSLKNNLEDISIDNLDLLTGFGKFKFIVNRDIKLKGITIKKQSFDVELKVAGYSSVMNAIVAITIGLVNGIDLDTILAGIQDFTGVERRFEVIFDEGFKIVDDHFANKNNIEVTLDTLSKMDYKNLDILYAIRGSRGADLNEENAEVIASWYDRLKPREFIVTLSKDTVTWKDEVTDDELEAFKRVMSKHNIKFVLEDNLKEAVEKVIDGTKDDDLVLFAGCQGMDKAMGIAYDHIIEKNLTKYPSKLLEKAKNRVC